MSPTHTSRDPDRTPFEEALLEVIARSYANGETVEGTWELATPIADAPDWIVEVRKVYSDEDSPFDPELID